MKQILRNTTLTISLIDLSDDVILYLIQYLFLEELNQLCQVNHMFQEDIFQKGISIVLSTHVISSPMNGNQIMSYKMQRRYYFCNCIMNNYVKMV